MEKHKLVKQFLKYCPRCKIYHPSAWKECSVCKKALRSFFLKYYVIELFKKVLLPLIVLSICVYGTYGIQINERAQYKEGFNLLINKKFRVGWNEIKGALAKNPLYKYMKLLVGSVKGKSAEIKEERHILQEIFFDINSKSSALINNKVVFEGDSVGEIKIIKVNIDSVDIEINGRNENIKFGRIGHFYNKANSAKIIKDGREEEKLPNETAYIETKHYEKVINYYKEALPAKEVELYKEALKEDR